MSLRNIFPAIAIAWLTSSVCLAREKLEAPTIADARLGAMRYSGESIVYWVNKMSVGDNARAKRLQGDLTKLRDRTRRMRNVDADQVKLLETWFESISTAINAKSGNTTPKPEKKELELPEKPKPLTQPATGNAKTAPQIQISKTRRPKTEPPAVTTKLTRQQATEFVNAMQAKYGNGGAIELPKIRRLFNDNELSEGEVNQVLSQLAAYQTELAQDLPRLKEIVAATGQGKYWAEWLDGKAMDAYQQEIRVFTSSADQKISRATSDAKYKSELDIEKHNFQFRGDAALRTLDRFEKAIAMIDQVARLEEPFGLKGRWSGQKADLVKHTAKYRAMVEEVDSGKSTKLPRDVGDGKLRKIAETVLKKDKYEIGEWERLIVNVRLMPRERIEHKAFSGRIETVVRKWEEFQVTTVEKALNGRHYLYYNVIAKFSRAPATTPIGEWILSKRFKGNAIADENLSR